MDVEDQLTTKSISNGNTFRTELNGSNMETIPEDT